MILSDRDISIRLKSGSLCIYPPPEDEQLQPASVDVRLGCSFIRFRHSRGEIDVRDGSGLESMQVVSVMPNDAAVRVEPGEFLLATTAERVVMPDDLVARIEGRSSLARVGLAVHVTAGFIDPGFAGYITLELANANRFPITIYTGMRIAQLAFESLTSPALRPYGHESGNSKYQFQTTATPSRIASERD